MTFIKSTIKRIDGRNEKQLRPVVFHYDVLGYSIASILFEQGGTKVLCAVTLQPTAPRFLRGQRVGWLTAEYAMLPCATQQRTRREATLSSRNARNVEISRLIGRCLRPTVDLTALGERTIMIDCDVLQADGGTRVACITAASLAIELACKRWHEKSITKRNIFKEPIAAISVGCVDKKVLLDLSYIEDSKADTDFNFIITKSGSLIEVQGTAEKGAISWDNFEQLKQLAIDGVSALFDICSKAKLVFLSSDKHYFSETAQIIQNKAVNKEKLTLFGISNRVK